MIRDTKHNTNLRKCKFQSEIFVLAFCLLVSVALLLIATKSSPLYPFNDWVDTNASFTMGKAMMNGRVLYRDIFDQRGPLLYFLYGLGYLISNTSFLGVFILEAFLFTVFLFYSYKFLRLYINSAYSLFTLPILAAIVLNQKSFAHGGSPEELCLPLVALSLFYLSAYYREIFPKLMPYRWILINGLIAGCVLWIKFSLLGFWFGWIISILVSSLDKRGLIRALKSSLVFLIGLFFATLPWIIYFSRHQAIHEWIHSYFLINLMSYSNTASIISILKSFLDGVLYMLIVNPFVFILILFGMIIFLSYDKFIVNFNGKLSMAFCFLFLTLGVFGGGRHYYYYFMIFSPFIIFGLIAILNIFLEKFGDKTSNNSNKSYVFISFSFLVAILYTLIFNHNTYMMKINREELVQYKFASIINQTKNPTLLNYGVLDLGIYNTAQIIPNFRFFQNQNISYDNLPLVMNEQDRYIKQGLADYVVTVLAVPDDIRSIENPYLFRNYVIVEQDIQTYEGNDYKYFLFRKK